MRCGLGVSVVNNRVGGNSRRRVAVAERAVVCLRRAGRVLRGQIRPVGCKIGAGLALGPQRMG